MYATHRKVILTFLSQLQTYLPLMPPKYQEEEFDGAGEEEEEDDEDDGK